MSKTEIGYLEEWVKSGAKWPGYEGELATSSTDNKAAAGKATFTDEQRAFWAFQPLGQFDPPKREHGEWAQTPIDTFIMRRLADQGLQPAAASTRRNLIRRTFYSLTGLHPTFEQVEAFEASQSPEAFNELVEQLLESPRYGEHWGRHWLDVVRYAESAAHDGNNAYVHAWRYRDYVIQSFNKDKPYDEFIIEQLAGDLLPPTEDLKSDYDRVVATGFLQVGTKPVVMRDKQQMLLDIADELVNTTGVAFLGLTVGCARCHDHKFDPIPSADYYSMAGIFTSTHIMADNMADSKWLEYEISDPDGNKVQVMAVRDLSEPADLPIHLRGNYRTLGDSAPREVLQIVTGDNALDTSGSGRLELARWIASPENPLTARVMVNRIWQYHFGQGLVSSSGNFGSRGELPSHPELLDWLAHYFIKSGWSVKAMYRLILSSATYQQSYRFDEQAHELDSRNKMLWRMPRRRLEGEEIRDTMLEVAGRLTFVKGGTFFTEGYNPVDAGRGLFTVQVNDPVSYRPFNQDVRSVYLPVIRNVPPEVLQIFDVANNHESTAVRSETTVAPQALFMLNSDFARRAALRVAQQIVAAVPELVRVTDRIEQAYQIVLGRSATDAESQRARQFIDEYRPNVSDEDVTIQIAARTSDKQAADDRLARVIRETDGLVEAIRLRNLSFNGVDQGIEIKAPEELNDPKSDLTVEYLVRPNVSGLGFVVGRDGATERLWKSGLIEATIDGKATSSIFYEFFNEGGFRTGNSKAFEAPVGEWTHVAFTKGNGLRQLFINGEKVDEVEFKSPLPVGQLPIAIGSRLETNSEWLNGTLDYVALYERALSDEEISSHYEIVDSTRPKSEVISKEVVVWQAFCQSLMCLNEFIYTD